MTKTTGQIEATLDRCMKVQPKTLNEPRAHLRAMMRLAITEYTHADIYDENVKELLSTLRKWQELGERTLREHAVRLDANTGADFCQGIGETKDVLKRFGENK
jgi:ribosomal protein S4